MMSPPRFRSLVLAGALGAPLAGVPAGPLPAQDVPAVRGVVFDSTVMRPLAGARVQLVAVPVQGAPRTLGTDATGAFRFDSLPLGAYLVGFTHPRLDSLGVEPALVRVDVRAPGTIVAPLTVPSARTLVRTTCQSDLHADSTGIFRGFVRSAADGFPVPRARLRLEWPEFLLGRKGFERATRAIEARTNDRGGYLICGVPASTTILARAFVESDSSGVVELEVPVSGLLARDLVLGARAVARDAPARTSTSTTATATDSAPPAAADPAPPATTDASLVPTIRGVVRDADGAAVGGARVQVLGDEREATTGDDGRFTLTHIGGGTQMLAVRALGYHPGKAVVDVTASGVRDVEVVLRAAPPATEAPGTVLDTLRVTGLRRLTETALATRRGFERRMQSGVGLFLTDSAVIARQPHLPSELFRGLQGLTVTSGSGGQGVYMRASATFNATKGLCLPTVYLDGARAPRAPIDQMVTAQQIRAVEVYARGEQAPPQFQNADGCGAIVIWTRTMWDASATGPRR